MKLVVLGSAGYHPNEHRQTTCVFIPEAGIVLDAGTAVFRLPKHLETSSLDILLSHAHIDHVVGLTYLLDVVHQYPLEEIRVHAKADKLKAIRDHLFHPDLFPVEPPYVERVINDEIIIGSATVTHCPLDHPGGSIGFRIDFSDRSLAYITDTTAAVDANYVEFIRGVDLLIHECNFRDGMEDFANLTGHSCLHSVAKVAKHAGVGGLVLMHFNPLTPGVEASDLARAEEVFSPIVVGEDGMEIEF